MALFDKIDFILIATDHNKMDHSIKTKYGLAIYNSSDKTNIEIGVDEAGRGPMFGRVYAAAVILPKCSTEFDHEELRDSKKIKSKKKLTKLTEYIKLNSIAWAVCYEDEKTIDAINIRQATLKAMHSAIDKVMKTVTNPSNVSLMIDGNDFKPYMVYGNHNKTMMTQINHTCFEGGDNKFTAIAAASILAKTDRDAYILDICERNPLLKDNYSIDTNKGYGTKKHIDGINKHGITQWHRKSYGICKNY